MAAAARREDIEEEIRQAQLEQLLEYEKMEQQVKFNRIAFMFPDEGPLRRELYVETMAWLNATAHFMECVIFGGNRTGKSLKNGTPVLTPKGWRPIEDLSVGDTVIGGDGQPCYVTGVFPQGVRPMIRMTFDDGASVECDPDHLWKCRQGTERYKKNPEWVVRSTAEIIARGGGSGNHQTVAEIPVAKCYIASTEVRVSPYIVGLLLGDGCYTGHSSQPSFSTADSELLEAVAKDYPVSFKGSYDYLISGGLVTDLKWHGLWGKKSYEKTIPKDYLWNNAPARLALLQGLMDTDGSADKGGFAEFYSTSIGLVNGVVFLVRSLGGKATVKPKQTHYFQKGEKVAGRPSWVVRVTLPVCPFRLKRKADRWKPLTARGYERRLVTAEPTEPAEATCISVDSLDSTYVTKDFIVTHNTETGAFLATLWATGDYPDWFKGKRFPGPTIGVVAGKNGKTVRNSVQVKLIGSPDREFGTGLIPLDRLVLDKCKKAHGTPNLYDTLVVRHVSGEESTINLKSYDQGRQAFEATKLHWVWEDEEAPQDIHQENMQRVFDIQGTVINTYTPLKGQTELTRDLRRRATDNDPTVYMTTLTWDNVPHITPEMIAAYEKRYPAHEMKARRWGIPKMGAGAVFTTDFDEIIGVKPFAIPDHWPRAFGLDFGWSPHPTAAIWGAWDRDADVLYLYSEHRMKMELPEIHAAAIKMRGEWIKGNSETAGTNASDGQRMIEIYRNLGLNLIKANKDKEANIYALRQRVETGRLKVFNSCIMWREEYESYHRDENGKLYKEYDDLMDATQYLISRMNTFDTKPVKRPASRVTTPKFGDFSI